MLSDVNEGKRCLDRQENVVSQMISPVHGFFFYDSGKQIVYDVRHVAQGFPSGLTSARCLMTVNSV